MHAWADNNDCNNAWLDCEELCVSSCANTWGIENIENILAAALTH